MTTGAGVGVTTGAGSGVTTGAGGGVTTGAGGGVATRVGAAMGLATGATGAGGETMALTLPTLSMKLVILNKSLRLVLGLSASSFF